MVILSRLLRTRKCVTSQVCAVVVPSLVLALHLCGYHPIVLLCWLQSDVAYVQPNVPYVQSDVANVQPNKPNIQVWMAARSCTQQLQLHFACTGQIKLLAVGCW